MDSDSSQLKRKLRLLRKLWGASKTAPSFHLFPQRLRGRSLQRCFWLNHKSHPQWHLWLQLLQKFPKTKTEVLNLGNLCTLKRLPMELVSSSIHILNNYEVLVKSYSNYRKYNTSNKNKVE